MENPPEVVNCLPGSRFTLFAPNLCSLEIGSPVYYRRIEVGHVIGYDLDPNGDQVNIQVFIDAPNDKFVTKDTRFWDVSGFNLTFDRKSVGSGKRGSVRVDLGGCGIIKKKTTTQK